MATLTIANGGGNWNSTGTWVEGAVPSALDDVVATATSGNVTINVAAACRSIDLTNYTGTLTHNAFTLTIGTSTANGTKALVFPSSGWTYTLSDTVNSAIAFSSTVASTTLTVDFGAKTTGSVSFSADATSGYQLVSHGFTCGASAIVTHTQGTLDTNGQTCSWGSFNSNNSNTRTLLLGASALTLTSTTTAWDTTTTTGLTFNAGTSTITIGGSGSSGTTATMNAGSLTYSTVAFAVSGTWLLTALNGSNPTFANFTVTGQANAGAVLSLGTSITVTTALTLNGNSATQNRLLIKSSAVGTQRTITNNGSATFSNLDLQDIAGAGTASWNLSAITGKSGDCLGNSGITFTSPRTLFWVGNTGSWSVANKWSLTSGGTANQSNPLAQDTITFDSHSFSATGQTVTCDMPRMGSNVDFTNVTNNPTLSLNVGTPFVVRLYGSLTLVAGMSWSAPDGGLQFEGRGSSTFTTAGITVGGASGVTVSAPGGTLTLNGDLSITGNSGLVLSAGTLATNNNVTVKTFLSNNNSIAKTLNMGSGTWTLNGTGTVWNTAAPSSLTINANTSTIVVSDTSATAKTFNANGGFTYNVLTVSGDNVTISFSNTFASLNVNNAGLPNGLKLAAAGTQTITGSFATNGSAGNPVILASTSSGSAATLSKTNGTVSVDYTSIKDSHAVGGASWYAGTHSTNVSGNTGWIFEAPPSWTSGWGLPI